MIWLYGQKLLGYYFLQQYRPSAQPEVRLRHILWVIDNAPKCSIAGEPWCSVDVRSEPDGFVKARELWLRTLNDSFDDTTIIGNAANFFIGSDNEFAEQLIRKGLMIDPANSSWSKQLSLVISLSTKPGGRDRKGEILDAANDALTKASDELQRFYLLTDIPDAAFDVGYMEQSQKTAEELIAMAAKHKGDWNEGNAIYLGHDVLGRIALRRDDRESAIKHLRESGKTPGSPQLNSFGPPMKLAQAMVEAGERTAVVEYLRDCKAFWKTDRLEEWIQQIEAGDNPKLGRGY